MCPHVENVLGDLKSSSLQEDDQVEKVNTPLEAPAKVLSSKIELN